MIDDIALLKLTQPITFSKTIRPIDFQESCDSSERTDAIAIGNGCINEKYKLAPILHWTPMNTISFKNCKKIYNFLLFHRSMVCASNVNGGSIQEGDSDGPLIWNNTLIGISSFMPPLGVHPTTPQGFTDVLTYHEWIANTTRIKLVICR